MKTIAVHQDQTVDPIAKAKDLPHSAPPESDHESQTWRAVAKDRAYYDHPENPRQKFGLNINDQANSQSSPKDYIRTHSRFYHAEDPAGRLNADS